MRGLFRSGHFIFAGMKEQRIGQSLPLGHGKTKAQKKRRLAAAGGMPRIEQIMG